MDVIATMLEGKNNTFSLPWEIRSIFKPPDVRRLFSQAALHWIFGGNFVCNGCTMHKPLAHKMSLSYGTHAASLSKLTGRLQIE